MSRLWPQATQTCQLPTQIRKEPSAAMFFGQNTSRTLGLNVYPTIISSSNKRCCHLKVKVIQGTVKQKRFRQKLKDTEVQASFQSAS